MANRHLARSIVLQTLFECDSNDANPHGAKEVLDRNVEEFRSDPSDSKFMHGTLAGILAKQEDIDLIIGKAAPDWPIDKISPIDRNILRLGLYELLFADRNEVPAKVAINEAIELAKTFGSEASSRFINGVMGAVYKEIGEPGKDEVSARKNKKELPIYKMAGGIVYAQEDGQIYLALVHDVFGYWTLSKGQVEKDKDSETGILRVIKEELGLNGVVEKEVGRNEYTASHPEEGKLRKQVVYYIVRAEFDTLELKKTGGLDDARWFKIQDILELNFYSDMLPIITKAVQIIVETKSNEKSEIGAN